MSRRLRNNRLGAGGSREVINKARFRQVQSEMLIRHPGRNISKLTFRYVI